LNPANPRSRVKNEKSYIRERDAFSGFTLETARTLAEAIKANAVKTKTDRDRVHITLKVKLPDANKLSQDLLGWDETRLNALPTPDQRLLIQRLQQLSRHGKLPMIEGEEDFELIRESGRWKLYLNWAAGIRVDFHSRVTDSLPIEVSWDQSEVVARPGEQFNVHFNVKNTSDKEIFTKVPHRVEPQDLAGYLELVECGIVSPIRLLPREQQKYAFTYMIRGDLPDGIKRIAVTYELANVH
jgi:hypothetical protein